MTAATGTVTHLTRVRTHGSAPAGVSTGMNTMTSSTTSRATITCSPDAAACDITPATDSAPVKVTYVTDPICSACWVMEPAWRSLQYHYGDQLDLRYVYGGLVREWAGFMDAGAGIRKPEDVSHHWDEIAEATGQPINSSVWITDPIPSSYPPSIAAIAVRLTAPSLEGTFLRGLREQLFVFGRNIARPDVWWSVAEAVNVPLDQMRSHLDDGSAEQEFREDLGRFMASGARGFPTLIFEAGDARLAFHGPQPFPRLQSALLTLSDTRPYLAPVTIGEATAYLKTASTAEYSELLGLDSAATESLLTNAGMRPMSMTGGRVWQPADD